MFLSLKEVGSYISVKLILSFAWSTGSAGYLLGVCYEQSHGYPKWLGELWKVQVFPPPSYLPNFLLNYMGETIYHEIYFYLFMNMLWAPKTVFVIY